MFTNVTKVVISLLAAIIFIGFISACSTAKRSPGIQVLTPSGSVVSISKSVDAPKLSANWDGVWKSNPALFEATIAKDVITINIVSTDSSSLYWKGTRAPSKSMTNRTTIISQADANALDASITGSQDRAKVFTYLNNELLFKFTMMGTTKTVHLTKE